MGAEFSWLDRAVSSVAGLLLFAALLVGTALESQPAGAPVDVGPPSSRSVAGVADGPATTTLTFRVSRCEGCRLGLIHRVGSGPPFISQALAGWHGKMAPMPLVTPTLHTARLRLRPFTDADAGPLFALHSSAHVLRYWDAPPWTEPARAARFIAACRQMEDEGTGARLAVDRASDGAFIGWCSLTRWNPDYRSAALGYVLDDAAWGRGYATEAARALLQWAFDTSDLNRVQAETDTRNTASARVLEKLGFVREGTLREDCVVNGEVSDSWVFGLIRREWRPASPPVPTS